MDGVFVVHNLYSCRLGEITIFSYRAMSGVLVVEPSSFHPISLRGEIAEVPVIRSLSSKNGLSNEHCI